MLDKSRWQHRSWIWLVPLVLWAATSPGGWPTAWAGAEPDTYRLKLVVTTTSDWTSVGFDGALAAGFLVRTVEGATAPDLRIQSSGPSFGIWKRAYDVTKVIVEYDVYLTSVSGPWLTVNIGKGHIGFTQLDLYAVGGQEPRLIARFIHRGVATDRDPENPRRFGLSVNSLARGGPIEIPRPEYPRRVLAFYYPWYGTPQGPSGRWVHWDPSKSNFASTHTPLSGWYDSLDEDTIVRHIRQAKAAGIDGFIASWWGSGTFEDRAFQKLLRVAEREGFLVTIYHETAESRLQVVGDFSYVVRKYGGSPAFLKVDDLPVIFVYGRVTHRLTAEDWRFVFEELAARDVACFCVGDGIGSTGPQGDRFLFRGFRGAHVYIPVGRSPEELKEFYQVNALRARVRGLLFATTVVPGYDDRVIRTPGFSVDRQGGAYYRETWEAALGCDPDWILITSFNEWHEGTEIEPSREFGNRYLELTRELVDAWRGD